MGDWTEGYLAEIDYTHGYYRELCPSQLAFAALNQRLRAPDDRPIRYLELGFGQGLSLNIHAAACQGEFWGTDFNPAQAANAREMADAAGTGAKVFDLSFDQLAKLDTLPEFDVITMHGIWSWVNDENRAIIVDLLHRKLAVGGLLFISYNCYPGWAQSIPLRHLLTLHAELAGSPNDGIINKIDNAMTFVKSVADNGSLFFHMNPSARDRLNGLMEQDRHYLAHEYFNKDWHPMPFSTVAEQLNGAKLTYGCSANLLDHIDALQLTPHGMALLGGVNHPILRESVRDYMTNRQFRKDVFIKGPVLMSKAEQTDTLRQRSFVLMVAPENVGRKQLGTGGEMTLPEGVYGPLVSILAEDDHRPKSLQEIEQHPLWGGQPFDNLREAIIMLIGNNQVSPVQSPSAVAAVQDKCKALNMHLMQRARFEGTNSFLASPLTGGGIAVNRYNQLFLLAYESGYRQPHEMAVYVWNILAPQGIIFQRDGQMLTTVEDNVAQLTGAAQGFADGQLPFLRTVGIASP